MKNKYGVLKNCLYCNSQFITKSRFLDFCSTPCKNPINRPGNRAWNKGIKLTEEQKTKQNRDGLKKGWGWNKGKPNEAQRQRMLGENNPNWNGKINNLRSKKTSKNEFTKYKTEVRKATYRTLRDLKKSGHYVPKFGKYNKDLQVDHVISIKQGYELGIAEGLLGSIKNIQFLRGEDNRAKWHLKQNNAVIFAITGEWYGVQ